MGLGGASSAVIGDEHTSHCHNYFSIIAHGGLKYVMAVIDLCDEKVRCQIAVIIELAI